MEEPLVVRQSGCWGDCGFYVVGYVYGTRGILATNNGGSQVGPDPVAVAFTQIDNRDSEFSGHLITRHGIPTAVQLAGISSVTTLPAAMMDQAPTLRLGRMHAPVPN